MRQLETERLSDVGAEETNRQSPAIDSEQTLDARGRDTPVWTHRQNRCRSEPRRPAWHVVGVVVFTSPGSSQPILMPLAVAVLLFPHKPPEPVHLLASWLVILVFRTATVILAFIITMYIISIFPHEGNSPCSWVCPGESRRRWSQKTSSAATWTSMGLKPFFGVRLGRGLGIPEQHAGPSCLQFWAPSGGFVRHHATDRDYDLPAVSSFWRNTRWRSDSTQRFHIPPAAHETRAEIQPRSISATSSQR